MNIPIHHTPYIYIGTAVIQDNYQTFFCCFSAKIKPKNIHIFKFQPYLVPPRFIYRYAIRLEKKNNFTKK